MNPLKILSEKEKKDIEKQLNERFGVDFIPGKIITRGNERLFLFTGNFNEKEIEKLESLVFVERLGIYFAKIEENEGIRLSIEGSQILGKQIKKNIFSLNSKQAEEWMKGHEILFEDIGKKDNEIIQDFPRAGGEQIRETKVLRTLAFPDGKTNLQIHKRAGLRIRGVDDEVSEMKKLRGFVIIKHKNDFLGSGKASENKITNFIPKNRRLKEKG